MRIKQALKVSKNIFYLFISLIALAQHAYAHQPSGNRLILNNNTPEQAQLVTFTYQPEKGAKPQFVKSVLLYYANKLIYAIDIKVDVESGVLKGSFTIPDSAQAIALAFKTGEGRDTKVDHNGGAGYVYPVCKNKQPLLGSLASMALFYSDPSSAFFTGVTLNYAKANELMKKEFTKNPIIKKEWIPEYLRILGNQNNPLAIQLLDQIWSTYLKACVSEDRMLTLIKFSSGLVSEDRINRMNADVLKIYPRGFLAVDKAAQQLPTDPSAAITTEPKLKKLMLKFSKSKWQTNPTSLDFQYTLLAKAKANKSDQNGFMKYSGLITDRIMAADANNYAANRYLKNNAMLMAADSLAANAIRLIRTQQEINKTSSTYYTVYEKGNELEEEVAQYLDTYAQVSAARGDFVKALKLQQQSENFSRSFPERNGRYINYLVQLKNYNEARQEGESFVRAGTADGLVNEGLKYVYEQFHQDTTGFVAYLRQLEQRASHAESQKVMASMIDIPAPKFELTDLDGKTVTLSNLKGKVVVLDFWATWCGPCKASFPAMQAVADKYQADNNVIFLFINTWESGTNADRLKNIRTLMETSRYNFRILLDKTGVKGQYFTMADDYKLNAVPTKCIIDGNGHIRFRTEGFSGTTKALENELTAMIENAKHD